MKKHFMVLVFSIAVLISSLVMASSANAVVPAFAACPNNQNCGGQFWMTVCEQGCGSQKAGWCEVRVFYSPTCYERTCGGSC